MVFKPSSTIGLLLLFITASAGGLDPSSQKQSFQSTACPEDVVADRCGYVLVPLDHNQPRGKQIKIFVAVKESLSSLTQGDPIFYLAGGPGVSSSIFADPISQYIFTDRDIIGIDYRGGGYSLPKLSCQDRSASAIGTCQSQWKQQGIIPRFFNTVQAAQDVEFIRILLKYEKINLYGSSYGSLWAQEVMQRFPDHLRSVILSGVLPKNVNYFEELIPALEGVTQQILQSCGRDSVCNSAYPHLLERFQKEFPKLPDTVKTEVVALINYIGGASEDLGTIPTIVSNALNGKPLPPPTSFSVPSVETANGLNVVVNCQEHFAFTTPLKLKTVHNKAKFFAGIADYDEYFETCDILNLKKVSSDFHTLLQDHIPTLLFGGEFDTRTPVSWMGKMYPLSSKWQKVMLKGEGHVSEWSICGTQIFQSFMREPMLKVDAECAIKGEIVFK